MGGGHRVHRGDGGLQAGGEGGCQVEDAAVQHPQLGDTGLDKRQGLTFSVLRSKYFMYVFIEIKIAKLKKYPRGFLKRKHALRYFIQVVY